MPLTHVELTHIELALSSLAKIALPSLAPTSVQRLVKASNFKSSLLSFERISTNKLQYSSVKKSFANFSFLAKNSRIATMNGEDTRPLEHVMKNL